MCVPAVPGGEAAEDRPGGRTGAAASQAGEPRLVEPESVRGGRGDSEGGESAGGGRQARPGGDGVAGVHDGPVGEPGPLPYQVEESDDAPLCLARRGYAVEGHFVVTGFGVESHEGGRGEDVQGHRQAAGPGKEQLLVALAPVLDQGDVRVRDGGGR